MSSIWDDPEWDALRSRVNGRPSPKPQKHSKTAKTVTDTTYAKKTVETPQNGPQEPKKIHVSLSVPRIRPSKRQMKVGIAVTGLVIVGLVGTTILRAVTSDKSSSDTTGVLSEKVTEPEFDTILPDGKKDQTEDNKVGYDPQRKVASFRDTIGTVPITVSQQPLPEQFKENPDEEVKKVAESFSANQVINESSPKAYLGIDVSGAQTVIFHKKGVLVFILSTKEIDKDQWAEYITKLQ